MQKVYIDKKSDRLNEMPLVFPPIAEDISRKELHLLKCFEKKCYDIVNVLFIPSYSLELKLQKSVG